MVSWHFHTSTQCIFTIFNISSYPSLTPPLCPLPLPHSSYSHATFISPDSACRLYTRVKICVLGLCEFALFHLTRRGPVPSISLQMSNFTLYDRMNKSLQYVYTTFLSSIHLLMGTSIIWLFSIVSQ